MPGQSGAGFDLEIRDALLISFAPWSLAVARRQSVTPATAGALPQPGGFWFSGHCREFPAAGFSQQGSHMNRTVSLGDIVNPVISLVPRADLRDQLREAFSKEQAAVSAIEECFQLIPSSEWSKDLRRTFAVSWKATHLKMLAIYGLSCRLQRTADGAAEPDRSNLYLAAARNASTSYEDLGLDFDGQTPRSGEHTSELQLPKH